MTNSLTRLWDENADTPLLAKLWYLWSTSNHGGARQRLVNDFIAEHKLDFDYADVAAHLSGRAHTKQPKPNARFAAEVLEVFEPTERHLLILRFVEQSKVTTPGQIREFVIASGVTPAAAGRATTRSISYLRQHFAVHTQHESRKPGQGQAPVNSLVVTLGRVGAMVLQREYEAAGIKRARMVGYYGAPSEVDRMRLTHDLGTGHLLARLQVHGREVGFRNPTGHRINARFQPENVYTQTSFLGFGIKIPSLRNEVETVVAGREVNVFPDAFAVAELTPEGTDAVMHVPFFLEFDTGKRRVMEVADQLWKYLPLATSDAARKRFPELSHAPGYMVPVVMATNGLGWDTTTADGKPRASRIRSVVEHFERMRAGRQPLDRAVTGGFMSPPIYVCLQSDIDEKGWEALVVDTANGEQLSLGTALMKATNRLYQHGRSYPQSAFSAGHDFAFEPNGARPRAGGVNAPAVAPLSKREQDDATARKQQERRDLEARNALYWKQEEERKAALAATAERSRLAVESHLERGRQS